MLTLLLASCTGDDPGSTGPRPPLEDTAETTEDTSPPDTGPDTGTDTDPRCLPLGSTGKADAPTLSADALLADATPATPLSGAAFAEPDDADDPLHTFSGRLRFTPDTGQREVHYAEYWLTEEDTNAPLPSFDAEYVQCGRDLMPTRRGRIITEDAHWDLLLTPGRIWSTPHDDGYSRVALPFALSMKYVNCVFNGMMTFLYDGSAISQVRWQVTQETCHLMKLDAWGQAAGSYAAGVEADGDRVIDDFLAERAARPEVRAFDQLAVDHPEVNLTDFDTGLSLPDLSARGLLIGPVLYLDRCRTRYGDNPFCEDLILPSFSLAKTAYTALGLAAMAQELPTDPYSRTLGDLLGATGTWGEVTLENLVDMSSGHYLYEVQTDPDVPGFYESLDLEGRLAATLALPYRSPPGERVVYLTPNSQVAAAAMDAHLADMGAETTDSFTYVVEHVLKPAGVTADSFESLRTWEDGGENNGTGFGGYGWLHPDRLAETMFQTSDRGPQMTYYSYRYNNGMWGYPVTGCDRYAPILFGVSGITVLLVPNGQVYFAFTDAQQYPVANILTQTDQIQPLCD